SVSQEALDLVNTVRERSNATPVTATSKAELIEKILTERRIELAFEGHGIFEFLRSEEHTSELQSRENLVCRLLLEKKKKQIFLRITEINLKEIFKNFLRLPFIGF